MVIVHAMIMMNYVPKGAFMPIYGHFVIIYAHAILEVLWKGDSSVQRLMQLQTLYAKMDRHTNMKHNAIDPLRQRHKTEVTWQNSSTFVKIVAWNVGIMNI